MKKQRPRYQWPSSTSLSSRVQLENAGINLTRRRLLEKITLLLSSLFAIGMAIPLLGAILSPALRRKNSSRWVLIGGIEQFPEGEITSAELQSSQKDGWMETTHRETLWVRRAGQRVIVFSSTCTHAGCRVTWDNRKQRFLCPCHGGQYDAEGRVVAGPPPQPLRQYQVRLEGGLVWVKEA